MSKIVALLPMRAHSERVPNKNIRPFSGKPLYHYILNTLLSCRYINEVYIDTDSQFIMDDAPKHFAGVHIIERPVHLRSDFTSMNEVLLHHVSQVEADYYLQTHSTNPLLRVETITQAIETFLNAPEYDSLFSVTAWQTRFYDGQGQPINHDPEILLRTQDLPPIYEENSNLYLFSKAVLTSRRHRIGARPLMFEIDRAEAWDIDDKLDFYIAEFLYREKFAKEMFE